MMLKKTNLILVLVVALGFILRAYGIERDFNFSGEFGQNLLDIKNSIAQGIIPLVGPQTSHPWLYFGPVYYWLGIIVMLLFGKNPLIFAYLGIFAGVLAIVLNYFVARKLLDERTALISSFLIAISPLFIKFSKDARFYSFVLVLFYPFVLFLYKIWSKELKFMFWLGLIYGLMFSFHYSPIIYLPTIILVLILKREILRIKDYLRFFGGFFVANIPIIIFDSQQGFAMTKNLLSWIPYRIAGFFGLLPKNNATQDVIINNFYAIDKFLGGFPVSIFVILCLIYLGYRTYRERKISFGVFFILNSLIFGLAALFIHGDPPIHYFLPILPVPLLAVSYVFKRKYLILILLVASVLASFAGNIATKDAVPFKTQLMVSKLIVDDSKGMPFTLSRVGPYDYFQGNYAQNYQYLMWTLGNEPRAQGAINYTIYETGDSVSVSK